MTLHRTPPRGRRPSALRPSTPLSRTPCRSVAATAAATSLLLSAPLAAADEVYGSRGSVIEKSHRIELRLDRGHADLVVRRTVWNGGARHDQAVFMLDLPTGAVATGLASLGSRDGHPFWFRGELMEAEAAAEKYRELTGIGGFYPKDPALLSWRSQTLLALQVFPCAPGQPKTVEYTMRMPTVYRGGRHHLTLPRVGTEALPATVVAVPARAGDRLFLGDRPLDPGARFTLADDETDVALAPRPSLAVDGEVASETIAAGRELVQFRVDAPARLSEAPRGARVVVLLDASRSIDDRDGAAGIAAARAYLAHLPDAQVEVLTYDREVHPRHGRFVAAARAIADLERLTLSRKNGSRLDDALAQADALLARGPANAPRRILAITDLRTRSALTPQTWTTRLGAAVKSGALVHIGVAGEGEPGLVRDDESAWARPVRATGGLVWAAKASVDPADAGAMARVYEEWARPVRIDKLAVRARGIDGQALGFPEQLPEGEGVEHHRIHDGPVPEVVLTGELWARPLRAAFAPSEAHGRLWSALAFGSDLLGELTEPEMAVLANRGRAVSPVTSYLAIEPGVRPSTEGLEWSSFGEGGGGFAEGIGLGSVGTIGHGGGFDHAAYLRDALGAAFRRCPAGPKTATVAVETTVDEVVDVPAIEVAGGGDAPLRRCLEDAAWALDLPGAFASELSRYDVVVTR